MRSRSEVSYGSLKTPKTAFPDPQIRRALPRACQIMSACRVLVSTIVPMSALFFTRCLRNKNEKIEIELQLLRETSKNHEQKSTSSSCCCFLLELLFIVQKTAPARGAVQEPPGIGIESCLRLARHLFLKHFLEGQKIEKKIERIEKRAILEPKIM